jgi:hypothetical protein
MFEIRMGVPEMKNLWDSLSKKHKDGTLSKDEAKLFKKWSKALKFLRQNPRHQGLGSHDIDALSRRYGGKVWQSNLENNTPAAGRMFWIYGPNKGEITVIGLEPHPEDAKSAGYAKVRLSSKGKE